MSKETKTFILAIVMLITGAVGLYSMIEGHSLIKLVCLNLALVEFVVWLYLTDSRLFDRIKK